MHFVSEKEKYAVILSHICINKVYSEECKNIICEYLQKSVPFQIEGKSSYIDMICILLSSEMNEYYSTKQAMDDEALIKLFSDMDMIELSEMLKLFKVYDIDFEDDNIDRIMGEEISRAILDYCENVPGEDYYEEYDMKVIIEECSKSIDVVRHCSNGDLYVDQEYELDYDVTYQTVYAYIVDDIKEEILTKFEEILSKFEPMEPDYDDYESYYDGRDYAEDTLDCIFRDGAI